MRIPRSWVPAMSRRIANMLLKEELVTPDVDKPRLLAEIESLLMDELTAEDRINAEVREILKKFDDDIAKGRVDYRKLFELTKQKLVKDRGVVI